MRCFRGGGEPAHRGGSLKYCGARPGATKASAFEELCRPQRRQELPTEIREALCHQQAGLCADCGDELKGVGSYEIDHRVSAVLWRLP